MFTVRDVYIKLDNSNIVAFQGNNCNQSKFKDSNVYSCVHSNSSVLNKKWQNSNVLNFIIFPEMRYVEISTYNVG